MNNDADKWRSFSKRAGERVESGPRFLRFSRKLLVTGALFLIAAGIFGWL